MGTIACCQPDTINIAAQQVIIPEDFDSKLSGGIDFINLLQQQIENHFFIDYKPSAGIQTFIGINVQNLSSLHNFIKELKFKDYQSQIGKASNNKKMSIQSNINTQCEAIVDQIKTALFQLKKNTKKHVKALDLNQTRNSNNFVDVPYYLPWIQTDNRQVCVYIGEWKYESRYLMKNFPSGVGRLYINDQVWQGEMQISIQKLQEFSHSTIQSIQQALTSSYTSTRQKISIIKNNFALELNGYGRKFTKDDEYCGQFEHGLLNGKGQYKNLKHDYVYQGTWVQNAKNGKGIQKTKTSKYQGQWKDNKKNGQGTLIFYISAQQEKQRLKQQKVFDQLNDNHAQYKHRKARVTIEMNLQEISDKQVKQTLSQGLHKYKGHQLLTFQHQNYTPWQIKGFPFVNKNFIENLKFEQLMKTNFLQKYVGEFVDDHFHGKGMYQWAKGNFYVGDWINGKMEGLGKFYWKQGYAYYGEYKNDLKHGRGEMKWDPYKRHRGNWAFGKKHGYGQEIKIVLSQNQSLQIVITAGLWKNNILDENDKYFSKYFLLENDPNYINFSGILKHNYFFYHPDAKIDSQTKFKIIQQSAKNYFSKPCKYCGNYILKEEKSDNKGVLQEIFRFNKNDTEEKKTYEENQGPENCSDCQKKMKQLQEIQKDKKNQSKKES